MTTEKQPTVASMQPFVIQRCETCHWWSADLGTRAGRNVCLWHTAWQGNKDGKIDFGGIRSFRTMHDFGCVSWEADRRNKVG